MDKLSLNSNDVIKIMKLAKKQNVASIQIGDLRVEYHASKEESQDKKSDGFVPPQITDKLQNDVAVRSDKEREEYAEAFNDAALDCEDPAGYEDAIFNYEKNQEQDVPVND